MLLWGVGPQVDGCCIFCIHLLGFDFMGWGYQPHAQPLPFYDLGTTLGTSYMTLPEVFQLVAGKHSKVGHRQGSHMAMALVRTVTYPSINIAHDCSTLIINHEMLTPSYQGSIGMMAVNPRSISTALTFLPSRPDLTAFSLNAHKRL